MGKAKWVKRIVPQRKLVITKMFRDNLDSIAEYGATVFGENVSSIFVNNVISKVAYKLFTTNFS
jgi:hypothetical protein